MKSNQVLLVQSSKRQPGEAPSWLLPQGGIKRGATVYHAAASQLKHELGITFSVDTFKELQEKNMIAVLGGYVNESRAPLTPSKLIIAVGIQIEVLGGITLNEENKKSTLVSSPYALWNTMANTRPAKLINTCRTISQAHMRGLIGWSCDQVLELIESSGLSTEAA